MHAVTSGSSEPGGMRDRHRLVSMGVVMGCASVRPKSATRQSMRVVCDRETVLAAQLCSIAMPTQKEASGKLPFSAKVDS